MKCIAEIEPHETDISEILERLIERAQRRQADVIFRVLRKLEADPDWFDRVARGPKPEEVQ
jgi:hypothetical protein